MTPPRRKRVRMEGFDYSTPGCYFITINAQTQAPWFGIVVNGCLRPNAAGDMVLRIWERLPERFPGTMVDAIVVMPDHLHGIIMLGTDPNIIELPDLSDIVRDFKSLTTVEYGRGVRSMEWRPYNQHLWHRSFQDTIIRNDFALKELRSYIEGNPGRWTEKHGS